MLALAEGAPVPLTVTRRRPSPRLRLRSRGDACRRKPGILAYAWPLNMAHECCLCAARVARSGRYRRYLVERNPPARQCSAPSNLIDTLSFFPLITVSSTTQVIAGCRYCAILRDLLSHQWR